MSRVTFGLIPAILLIILSVFFYLSPQFIGQKPTNGKQAVSEMINKRIINLGNFVSQLSFVTDFILDNDEARLSEVVTTLKQTEPEILSVSITDGEKKVIASSETSLLGTNYVPLNPAALNKVTERGGVFESGFPINLANKTIGIVYIKLQPKIPEIKIASSSNPIVLIAGIALAIITFVIMTAMTSVLESRLIEDINIRQEEVFLPKIEALKKQQTEAEQTLNDLNKKIAEGENKIKKLESEYAAKKKEYESSPVMQSVEKLRQTEAELVKRLGILKNEENKLNNEINLLSQKREEIMNALDAEKKEEARLHEKLDLIKKKILHLESPT
ncbi:MAG: hypothetical protein ACUVTF_06130 [bacterium]